MSHNPVLVPVLEIGTAVEAALNEEAHFVLVQVHFADVVAVIVVVDVVAAHLAVGRLRLFLGHVDSPLSILKNGICFYLPFFYSFVAIITNN